MVDSCEIRLWEHPDYTGQRWKSFNSSKPEGDSWINDRDSSAKIYGNCKNTSYLVFEHPNYTGYAYILGEGDNIPNLHDGNSHGKGKGSGGRDHRWYKRGDRMNAVQRIDIPTQNINEGRMRQDITIYGKRVDWKPHEWGHIPAITKASDAGDSDQWLTSPSPGVYEKGKPCPGGDAYWKGFQKISCVYNVKTGSGLGRLRTLHREQKASTVSNDPRKNMYDKLVTDYCDRADRLEDRVTSESGNASKCRSIVDAKALAKDYCKQGDKIKTDAMLCTKESDSLGQTLYDELASKYCDANPSDPFCGCYNVVTNKCLTEENKDLPGCKVTYPTRESIEKMPTEYRSNFDGTDKCWGNVCASSTGKYVPEGTIDALCSKTVAVCIADLDVGDLKESGVNIEQNCGINNQTTDGSTEGTPAPMPNSTTTPLETTPTPTPSPSSEDEDEEEKAFYEKPSVQIGTVASSLVSISSCAMLIMLAM